MLLETSFEIITNSPFMEFGQHSQDVVQFVLNFTALLLPK